MCTRTDAHITKNTKAFNKAMQYCPNCNKEFNDDKQFCSNCGCPLIEKLDSESYFLVLNGAQAGPYTIAQLTEFMCLGVMTQNTYVWKEGMPDWDFAHNVDKVKQLFTATPPPLPYSNQPASYASPSQEQQREPENETWENDCPYTEDEPEIDSELADLCREIKGQTYIETLNLNRSWILPQFVEMGFGSEKSFDSNRYINAINSLSYDRLWIILLRNCRALNRMQDKESTSYKIRKGWWSKDVAVALAEFDLKRTRKYISALNVYSNFADGRYIVIPVMRGCNYENQDNYIFTEMPRNAEKWAYKKHRSLNELYIKLERDIEQIRRASGDSEICLAVERYNNNRILYDYQITNSERITNILPSEYLNAYIGDGAFSSMMTMIKYLGLRCLDYCEEEMSRDECITEIAEMIFDNNFNGKMLLSYCVNKYFDSGVFDYNDYKGR